MKKLVTLAATLGVLLSMFPAQATPGDLDSHFGGDGVRVYDYNGGASSFEVLFDLAFQQDRKIVGAVNDGSGGFTSVRYRRNGARDPDYGTNGLVRLPLGTDSEALTTAMQGRKILVGGAVTIGGWSRFGIARFRAGGAPDGDFGTGGFVTTPFGTHHDAAIHELKVLPNGKILAGGTTRTPEGSTDMAVARYRPGGHLDNSFSGDGKKTVDDREGDSIRDLDLDGRRIVLTGYSTGSTVADPHFFVAARLRARGRIDHSFSGDGIKRVNIPGTSEEEADAGAVRNGKVLIGGRANGDFTLVRLTGSGRLDETFSGDGIAVTSVGNSTSGINDLAVQGDGKIVAAGFGVRSATTTDFAVVRYKPSGRRDLNFGINGKVLAHAGGADVANCVGIDHRGRILAGGTTEEVDVVLMRFLGA